MIQPTPQDLRAYADDADQHGRHLVPISPATLRVLAADIERLQSDFEAMRTLVANGGAEAARRNAEVDRLSAGLIDACELLAGWIESKCPARYKDEQFAHVVKLRALAEATTK